MSDDAAEQDEVEQEGRDDEQKRRPPGRTQKSRSVVQKQ